MKKSCLLLLIGCLLGASPAFALRCSNRVVSIGDHKYDVLEKCGYPEYADQRYAIVGERFRHPGRTLDVEQFQEVLIEEWIYNFGPRRLKQYLRFENGVLIDIKSIGYGY